jgi:hypothetical protein
MDLLVYDPMVVPALRATANPVSFFGLKKATFSTLIGYYEKNWSENPFLPIVSEIGRETCFL